MPDYTPKHDTKRGEADAVEKRKVEIRQSLMPIKQRQKRGISRT